MKTEQEILNKLDSIIAKEPSQWLAEADYRFENQAWLIKSQAVALNILRIIRAKGISQKDLAEMLNVSPQQVNKWVKGSENFTFETISKIENALKIQLITVYEQPETEVHKNILSYSAENSFEYIKPSLNVDKMIKKDGEFSQQE